MTDPKVTILASLIASGGVLTWKGLRAGTLSPRTYAALVVVALMLLILGGFAPELASAFAVLVLVTVLLSSSAELAGLGNLTTKGK